jgi:hypothetical protein
MLYHFLYFFLTKNHTMESLYSISFLPVCMYLYLYLDEYQFTSALKQSHAQILFSDALSPDTCSVNTSECHSLTNQIIINPQFLFLHFSLDAKFQFHAMNTGCSSRIMCHSVVLQRPVFYNRTSTNTSNDSHLLSC